MCRIKRVHTLESIFENQGTPELYGEVIPIVFKKTITVDGNIEIDGGTLAYLEDTSGFGATTTKDNKMVYTMRVNFPTYMEDDYCYLQCIADLDAETIMIVEGGQTFGFWELFCSPNREAAADLQEYDKLKHDYEAAEYSAEDIGTSAAIFAVLFFIISLCLIGIVVCLNAEKALNSGAILGVLLIISTVGFYIAERVYYNNRLKQLRKYLKLLCDSLERQDAKSANAYINNNYTYKATAGYTVYNDL